MKDFTDEHINTLRRDLFINNLFEESDRGCVLVATSMLDESLELLLRKKLKVANKYEKKTLEPLFNPMGPLSTFSSKIKFCFALKLIEEWVYNDLEVIRKLRNDFAHNYDLASFKNKTVIIKTELLQGADYALAAISKDKAYEKPKGSSTIKTNKKIFEKERIRFVLTASVIGGYLDNLIKNTI
jgi:DNA-binding MltR family transcriptional regulator